MIAEPDLLPLPHPTGNQIVMRGDDFQGDYNFYVSAFTGDQLESYARANVAHATAAKDAEIEALRAQLDEQCRLHAISMDRELALITERDRLRVELRCLRQHYDERTACMIVHRGSALACSDAVRAAYSDEHRRAERLAEALRHLRNHTSVNSHQIDLIDTALNPTAAQEGKESFWPKLPGSGGPDWTGHD